MKIQGAIRKDLIEAGICLALSGAYWIGATHIHKSSLIGKGVVHVVPVEEEARFVH